MSPEDVLFVGQGQAVTAWYRCYQPAEVLSMDYVGLQGEPPEARWATGLVRVPDMKQPQSVMPDFSRYKLVVLQQPKGKGWLRFIRELQRHDIKVLYEVDDYLHGIKNLKDHDFKAAFTPAHLREYELCMRVCDGLIASTEYIARRYRRFNRRTFVCENGLDLKRYEVTIPERQTVNIGWAGATGHRGAVRPWLEAVARVMDVDPNVCFASIGQAFAHDKIFREFEDRAVAVPFCAVEQYPAAMTMFDIALAPAQHSLFHAGKSDLRWVEAGALGLPVVADPFVYGKIRHGYDGFLYDGPVGDEDTLVDLLLGLVADRELRTTVGGNARRYVVEERAMPIAAQQWLRVFEEILS